MEKVRFGKTGIMVSKVACGGIPIERISVKDAVEVVRGVIDLGVNFIDTANGYTDSEEKIGIAIKGVPRDSLVLASKSSARSKKGFMEHLDLSLRRLGTDYIDLYQHHNIQTQVIYDEIMGEGGAFEGMIEAIRAGKVRFPGFSSHNIQTAIRIMREEKFSAVQLAFNYIEDEAAKEAIPLARELGMGFLSMKPLGGGLLSDAKLSIKYLSQFDGVVPDPGIEKLSEMEEIVRIVESGEKFSAEDAAAIEKIKAEMGGSWCHRCGYCQPCPQNIGIGTLLSLQSFIKRLPFARTAGFVEKHMEAAAGCTECRECVGRCPYNLDIPELIKQKRAIWERYLAENK